MPANVRIHVAAAGLLFVLVAVVALFWSFPKLLVYVLLALVAALAYGALYLILAAWMDPKEKRAPVPPPPSTHDTLPDATDPDIATPTTRKKSTRKKKPTRKKKITRKKKTST